MIINNIIMIMILIRYEDLADALLRHFPQSDHAGGEHNHQDDHYHYRDQEDQENHDQYPHHLNLHRFRILKETKPHTPNGLTDVHCPMDE